MLVATQLHPAYVLVAYFVAYLLLGLVESGLLLRTAPAGRSGGSAGAARLPREDDDEDDEDEDDGGRAGFPVSAVSRGSVRHACASRSSAPATSCSPALTTDTNSPFFRSGCSRSDEQVRRTTVVGDVREEILEALRSSPPGRTWCWSRGAGAHRG